MSDIPLTRDNLDKSEDLQTQINEYKQSFFNNVTTLLDLLFELNEYIGETYNKYPLDLVYVGMIQPVLNSKLKDPHFQNTVLNHFLMYFNDHFKYDTFISKNIDCYKNILLEDILANPDLKENVPTFVYNIMVDTINNIFDEDIIEDDHLDSVHSLLTNIIDNGIKYGLNRNFELSDKRWLSLVA